MCQSAVLRIQRVFMVLYCNYGILYTISLNKTIIASRTHAIYVASDNEKLKFDPLV